MNRRKNLLKLRLTFVERLMRLERRLAATANLVPADRDPLVAYTTIEALNAWSQFSKVFYLSCVINAKTEGKVVIQVTPPNMSRNDALGRAIRRYKPYANPNASGIWARRDEPPWHDPNVLMQVCLDVNCSIHLNIQAAFSMGQRVFSDLPVFRNFYSHRNRLSLVAAQNLAPNYLLPSNIRPSEILLRSSPKSPNSLLVEWIAELRITAEFLCG